METQSAGLPLDRPCRQSRILRRKEEKKISPLGITEEEYAETAYDLDQIQEAGELIAVTLSGPDTYYEYKGKGFGLQFELAEHFAVSIGAKLRMEAVRDTAELFQRLKKERQTSSHWKFRRTT